MIMRALIRLMIAQGLKYLSYSAGRHLQFSAIGTLILGLLVVLFPVLFGVAAVWLLSLIHISPGGGQRDQSQPPPHPNRGSGSQTCLLYTSSSALRV